MITREPDSLHDDGQRDTDFTRTSPANRCRLTHRLDGMPVVQLLLRPLTIAHP
jgi:hypothetical protein